jgi:hypothetical protein
MDPASIVALTGACVAIARNATHFISALNDGLTRVRELGLDAVAVNARAGTLGILADRLRSWLDSNDTALLQSEREVLRQSVDACDRLVAALREAANRVTGGTGRNRGLEFLRKAVFVVFSQPKLDRYSAALNDQILALDLFLQTFNL